MLIGEFHVTKINKNKHMKVIAFIPARYAATRFPYKLMQPLGNKTVIRHTYDNTVATGLFDEVIVVTDDSLIYDEINDNGGKAMMSKATHESGSDRIAEAAASMDVDLIVNVQGDEPFVSKEPLENLIAVFKNDDNILVASLMKAITNDDDFSNANIVKLVCDKNKDALYFSRAAIPFNRNNEGTSLAFEHIGIYAFRKKALLEFTTWPMGQLEEVEKLEQLRYLENGIKIRMVETDVSMLKIDVPEDLVKAEDFLRKI